MSIRPIQPVIRYSHNSSHPGHPGPTVSLDPRPVVIPILSAVIGLPILVFALICALRRRAIRLRRREQRAKMQAGIRSVTLDLPPREKVSFFSGASSPEVSFREWGEPTQTTALPPSGRGGCRVQFAARRKTPSPPDASHCMGADVVQQTLAAATSVMGADVIPAWIEEGVRPT